MGLESVEEEGDAVLGFVVDNFGHCERLYLIMWFYGEV